METTIKVPLYAKAALIIICVFGFVFTLDAGQEIIIPIVYGTIFAILLNPFVNFLIRKKFGKVLAISITIAVPALLIIGTLYLVSTQTERLTEAYPHLKEKFILMTNDLVLWASGKFNIEQGNIFTWLTATQANAVENIAVGEILNQAGRISFVALLIPVYVFMILYYKTLLLEFIHKLFRIQNHVEVAEVLVSIKTIIQSYLVGLSFEVVIMAILNSAALLLLGIDYAILLGIAGAVLNIIPYIGGMVSTLLPMAIALVTTDSYIYPLLVLVLYVIIQFIDNNLIVPAVVARKVQINAFISIVVVFIGGTLWGVSGIFLSIPLTAIIKVICDHIEALKPWGFLLGNIYPVSSKFSFLQHNAGSTILTKH